MAISAPAVRLVAPAVWLMIFLAGAPAGAQQGDEVWTRARMRAGALRFTPTVEFVSGIDTNVFNASADQVSDFTWTLTPKADAAIRLGNAYFSGRGQADAVYFQHSASERSINLDGSARLTVPFNRIRPFVAATYLKTRQRPSLEIDARSLRHEWSASAGTSVRLSGKTRVDLAATTAKVDFDDTGLYYDTSLRDAYNRSTRTLSASLRHSLTALTTVTFTTDTTDERFDFSPDRNSRSVRVVPGVAFAASALVSGKASIGYETFSALNSSIPDFKGMVASVELAYTLLGNTRFTFQANRNLEYSYQATAPYYVLTGLGGGIVQRITDSLGITARATRYDLAYRVSASDPSGSASAPADTILTIGGGVLYKIGRDLRLTANVDSYRRLSGLDLQNYNGLRAGTSVAYGF